MHSKRFWTWTDGWLSGNPWSQGIATEQAQPSAQRADLHVCASGRTRTCTFGLEVRHDPSAWCNLGPSPQVASGPPSGRSHSDQGCYSDWIANWIASLTTGRANQSATTGYQELPSSPCREQAAYDEDHQLYPKAT
jgi:hypothetical protein